LFAFPTVADISFQIEKAALAQQWLEDQLFRQSEKPKNVDPVITSVDINKRKDDVQYSCASIMNRPKPKVSTTTEAPKEEPAPTTEEMDVD
jgi:heat shock protein 4